jgi:hypothetical protein
VVDAGRHADVELIDSRTAVPPTGYERGTVVGVGIWFEYPPTQRPV